MDDYFHLSNHYDIGPGMWQYCCCFSTNNLNLHHNDLMAWIIATRGNRLAFCETNYPVDGQIENVFKKLIKCW